MAAERHHQSANDSTVHPGILHHYNHKKNLVAFQYSSSGPASSSTRPQASSTSPVILLFIGGLGDGLLSVPYVQKLADRAACSPPDQLDTSSDGKPIDREVLVVQALLSSSYAGWGTGSVSRDRAEIIDCMEYFQALYTSRDLVAQGVEGLGTSVGTGEVKLREREQRWDGVRFVLMGHSTGCQDLVALAQSMYSNESRWDGIWAVILQAPVSDREALPMRMAPRDIDLGLEAAKQMIAAGRGDTILSPSLIPGFADGTCVSAARFYSLASTDSDEEDYFSSDLTDEKLEAIFGLFAEGGTDVLVLESEKDEHVPGWVNKELLLDRWERAAKKVGTNLRAEMVRGASHSLKGDREDIVMGMVDRVWRLIREVATGR